MNTPILCCYCGTKLAEVIALSEFAVIKAGGFACDRCLRPVGFRLEAARYRVAEWIRERTSGNASWVKGTAVLVILLLLSLALGALTSYLRDRWKWYRLDRNEAFMLNGSQR